MNEAQRMFFDICQPIWIRQATDLNTLPGLAKLRLEIHIGEKLGLPSDSIKQFENYTHEEIFKSLPFIKALQKITK